VHLEGVHHVTCITADGAANVDFYCRVLGLRLVKRTVNQDDPTAYHLFYADEDGTAGADITFFEYPGAARGSAGAGMAHRIVLRVGSRDALDFWRDRLESEGLDAREVPGGLRFEDPEGLGLELVAEEVPDPPLTARSRDIPPQMALRGIAGVHALVPWPARTAELLRDTLAFTQIGTHRFEARGSTRGGVIELQEFRHRGLPGAGTVHHVAWASHAEDHEGWRSRVAGAGGDPTPVIDRFYFRSVYFFEPSGILFEIATIGPGFAVDEPAAHLGERLSLPPAFEALRPRLERVLRPLPDPRIWRP
jgi:glyoxalase family protein